MKPLERFLLLTLLAVLIACSQSKSSFLFDKIPADKSGVHFFQANYETETDNIFTFEYFYNGGGVAVGDINNDGLPDLYFSSNQGENKLYLNKGDFSFEDITATAGVAAADGWKTGVTMADINLDGWLDIYVCRSKDNNPIRRKNSLLINNQNLTFSEQANAFGLDDDSYSTHAAFFDADRDGDLDAFILNHSLIKISNAYKINSHQSTDSIPYVSNRFLINNNGHFDEASRAYGIKSNPSNFGLGISVVDINNDGWPDIYTSCDYTGSDKLYLNHKGKYFNDATDSLLSHLSLFSMGLDIADANNDGLQDILTLDMLPPDNARQKQLLVPDRYEVFQNMVESGLHYQYMRNMLHVNNGNGTFSEIGQLAGLATTDWSWSPLVADFDNDGLNDVFITNSFKRDFTNNDFIRYRADMQIKAKKDKGPANLFKLLLEKMPSHEFKNRAFKNETGLTFSDKTIDWGFDHIATSTGATYADLDLDGDLDLIVTNLQAEAALYRNNSSKQNWLALSFKRNENQSPLGTSVTVYAEGKIYSRVLTSTRGFQSSAEHKLHIGLGQTISIDSIVVRWPDNIWQTETGIISNKIHTIEQKNSKIKSQESNKPLFEIVEHNIQYQHRENSFVDFKVQALLPHAYSAQGPALAVADVDGNGFSDYYLGGAAGQSGELWLQQSANKFTKAHVPDLISDKQSEDVDAQFFDADNDGDQDLYVVSGGYEFEAEDKLLNDRLYLNSGNVKFTKAIGALPNMPISGSCARPIDIDGDGDLDLFVGGRIVPGRYPQSAASKLLLNNGHGKFTDETNNWNTALNNLGLITDAAWIDINLDKQPDLLVCGEWSNIRIFINDGKALNDRTSAYFKRPLHGWWNCLAVADIDSDGDIDFVAGNHGLNNLLKPTEKHPVTLVFEDFDDNGSIDPILNYFMGGKNCPYPTRDELADQIPSIKKKFNDYKSYSQVTINTMFSPERLVKAKTLSAVTFQSSVFVNQSNQFFEDKPLPIQAQFAPIFSMAFADVNHDGILDLITGGNLTATRTRTGKLTGNIGFVFSGDVTANFTLIPPTLAHLPIGNTDVRKIIYDGSAISFAINNQAIQIAKVR